MAIKAGQILHVANQWVIDRIQTGGVSNLNIPKERIYETGNYKTVATIRDIPELSFDLESLDVSTETEAILTGVDPTSVVDGQEFDFASSMPFDIISPFKAGQGAYNVIKSVAVPYLTLENATYRFGVRQNAQQTFTLRGDSLYYIPGQAYFEEKTITSGEDQAYTFAHTALAYTEGSNTFYGLSVCAKNPTTHLYKRLFLGKDYTNTSAGIVVAPDLYSQGYTKLHITYGSATTGSYLQAVHQNVSVKPAAVRAKDICVYISDGAATPTLVKWSGVQSLEVSRRVNLQNDEEFCNSKYVSVDYDIPEVTGNLVIKSVDASDLFDKIQQAANVSSNAIAGPFSSAPLEMEIRINHPDTGATLKTLYVPDARFTIPAYQARANQKLEVTFPFESDGGTLLVYQGERP